MSSQTPATPGAPKTAFSLSDMVAWCRREPVPAVLIGSLLLVVIYFFGLHRVFMNGAQSVLSWAYSAWNPENDLEHGVAILPIALAIAWYHREAIRDAPKSASKSGIWIVLAGALLYVLSVRTLQPRLALVSLPLLIYGGVRYVWGKATARIILFPCAFLLFMLPLGFLVSRTVGLQTLAATVAAKLSGLLGIGVVADGTELRATNGAFQFEVAGGCSGIRSLTAMTMLAALYVHFTQNTYVKKVVIFASSLIFALIGNLFRIFTVVLFARFIDADIAAGIYHDYSGFIFFPIAVFCMLCFSNLLNRNYDYWLRPEAGKDLPATGSLNLDEKQSNAGKAISYDY